MKFPKGFFLFLSLFFLWFKDVKLFIFLQWLKTYQGHNNIILKINVNIININQYKSKYIIHCIKCIYYILILNYFSPIFHFYTPWKHCLPQILLGPFLNTLSQMYHICYSTFFYIYKSLNMSQLVICQLVMSQWVN